AEGHNAFQVEAPSNLTSSYLASFPYVILTQMTLTSSQASMYNGYVSNGGTLIAMRPDAQLASVFGLTVAGGATPQGHGFAHRAQAGKRGDRPADPRVPRRGGQLQSRWGERRRDALQQRHDPNELPGGGDQ